MRLPNHQTTTYKLYFCCALLIAALVSAGTLLGQGGEEAEAAPKDGLVLTGKIDGEINLVESAYVTRMLTQAEEREAIALAIELNTFGGRVDAAVSIRDSLLDAEIPTIVFINKRAISAGALISLACETVAISPGGTIGAATPIYSAPGAEMPAPVEEKYLSYFREEMRITAETHGRNGDIAEAMVDEDKVVEGVSEEGKLLTLTTRTALEHDMADLEARSLEEVLEELGYSGGTEEVERSWSEELVGFLTSSSIASLLFLLMMVLAYLEYQTPGFGAFGFGALICFMVLFFSHYLVNLAGWEEALIFGLGIVLLLVELFLIPGFGFFGIAGILCILASAAMLFLAGDFGDLTFDNPFTVDAVQRVLFSAVLGLAMVLVLIRFMPKTGRGPAGRLVLATALGAGDGFEEEDSAQEEDLVGVVGRAVTPLRPAGKAVFGSTRHEVETEGDFIDKGEAVTVLRREGTYLIVRRHAAEE